MSPKKKQAGSKANGVKDFRHDSARRKNNPPAGVAPTYEVRERKTRQYAYDPHLDPQLVWAGKAEHISFEVDVVSLHIHERISTRAILKAVRHPQPLQFEMFGETPLPADKQIEFYQHEVGWVNRLILGDSLLVMNSLLDKEGMAGKVQMIYIDPPYGIKYASNFQPRIDRRDVKDKDEDLTHEPEQIKAYRDTWTLGIHSYLTYLRDRLLLARELLTESGSIFVQINDENLHLVRCLLDEVFGRENFVAVIPYKTTGGAQQEHAPKRTMDFLLWYARNSKSVKFRRLFQKREIDTGIFTNVELPDGVCRGMSPMEKSNPESVLDEGLRPFTTLPVHSKSPGDRQPREFQGRNWGIPAGSWRYSPDGFFRLVNANRIVALQTALRTVAYFDDFAYEEITSAWTDTSPELSKVYTVQTSPKVIERCILMTTDPGDLVFDPTCGSGTTAYCAEKWGRRWITCDTSRVALAIARQRLMTAKFDYYELREPERGPAGGFVYGTVPHITLESIAKNTEIDAITAKYQPKIDQALAELNRALGKDWKEWEVPREIPHPVWTQEAKQAYWRLYALKNNPFPVGAGPRACPDSGPRACPDAGQPQGVAPTDVNTAQEETKRLLETVYRQTGHRWELKEIPDPMPPEDWPAEAREAVRRFWELKRQKRKEIDESIHRNAPQEVLYDKPQVRRGVVRVTGPFTVEAIPVPAMEDPMQAPIPQFETEEAQARVNDRGGDYLTTMINLLKQQGGVLFPGGKKMELQNLRALNIGYLHAEAETAQNGKSMRVAVSFGPQYGPVTATQANEAIQTAKLNAYDALILAGFSIEAEAQAFVQKAQEVVKGLSIHFANVAPDVLVGDLLKTTRASQIFTVFGQPDVGVQKHKDGTYRVELRGVDIYDPLTGEVHSTRGEDVAAWFLDTDYDGKTFHICQAFFPGDSDAWEKLQRALKAQIDPEAFEQMRGTISFPFQPGDHQRIAVKVIDFRGNEVVRVIPLNAEQYR